MRKHAHRKPLDPMGWINKHIPLADDQQRDLAIAYRGSLQALLTGHGTEQAWSTLACALNVSRILTECGIHAPALHAIKLAQESLLRSRDRAIRTGKWALDGEGIRLTQQALNTYDDQISRATRGQIVAALREVHRRVEEGEMV